MGRGCHPLHQGHESSGPYVDVNVVHVDVGPPTKWGGFLPSPLGSFGIQIHCKKTALKKCFKMGFTTNISNILVTKFYFNPSSCIVHECALPCYFANARRFYSSRGECWRSMG
jgi:hypothetical protein